MFHCIDKTNVITINGEIILLDYIRVKMNKFPGWRYMVQVQPYDEHNIPNFSLRFKGSSSKTYYYVPCLGFDINNSDWQNLITWKSVPCHDSQQIEMLTTTKGISKPTIDSVLPNFIQSKFRIAHAFYLI
jgi:hypothetical protein